jgi:hypothetical protein
MTKLEQALSKRALETLDLIRFERGFRTRAKTLEVILLEAVLDDETGDSIRLTPGERRIINQRLDEILQGKTVPASQVFAELAAKRQNSIRKPWDKLIPTGKFTPLDMPLTAVMPSVFQEELVFLISEVIAAKGCDFIFQNNVYVRGYLDSEIEKFENKFGFTFPKYYQDFLGVIGKLPSPQSFSYDYILEGSIDLETVFNIKNSFKSDYQDHEHPLPPLEGKIIFYYSHDATIYEFFIANSDDPKVFHWNYFEGIIDLECTFSERIFSILNQKIDFAIHGVSQNYVSKSKLYLV